MIRNLLVSLFFFFTGITLMAQDDLTRLKQEIDKAVELGKDAESVLRKRSLMHLEIPLTKPWLKGKINVESRHSRIAIQGSDQDFVSVDVLDLRGMNEQYSHLDSLRWITNKPMIQYTENNNVVTITEKFEQITGLIISIKVPIKFSADLKVFDESIYVIDLEGEIEASTETGDMTFVRVHGAIVADSNQGNINAEYKSVSPKYPNALSTVKGDVKLVIPETASVNVFISCEKGEINSDFRLKTSGKPDRGNPIKMFRLGLREASIGITSYEGDVNIYNSIRR